MKTVAGKSWMKSWMGLLLSLLRALLLLLPSACPQEAGEPSSSSFQTDLCRCEDENETIYVPEPAPFFSRELPPFFSVTDFYAQNFPQDDRGYVILGIYTILPRFHVLCLMERRQRRQRIRKRKRKLRRTYHDASDQIIAAPTKLERREGLRSAQPENMESDKTQQSTRLLFLKEIKKQVLLNLDQQEEFSADRVNRAESVDDAISPSAAVHHDQLPEDTVGDGESGTLAGSTFSAPRTKFNWPGEVGGQGILGSLFGGQANGGVSVPRSKVMRCPLITALPASPSLLPPRTSEPTMEPTKPLEPTMDPTRAAPTPTTANATPVPTTTVPTNVPTNVPISLEPTNVPTINFADRAEMVWFLRGHDLDGEARGDRAGWSVALSSDGNIVAVGARFNQGGGVDSGHVRVFEYDGLEWNKLGPDLDGEAAGDRFGSSVAMSANGMIVAVGAQYRQRNGVESGHVRVFELDRFSSQWTLLGQPLPGESHTDIFGSSVALSADGTTLVIASDGTEPDGSRSGLVSILQYNRFLSEWTQLGQDLQGQNQSGDFGASIALSSDGTVVAVGSILNDNDGSSRGQVVVYEFSFFRSQWIPLGQRLDGEANGDWSGYSVSLSSDGSIVAVGAVLNDGSGLDSGHVRIFEFDETMFRWDQLGQDLDGEASEDWAGSSVALSSDGLIVAVGARFNQGLGHVRIFEFDTSLEQWVQQGPDVDGNETDDWFGHAVALSADGSVVAVGAPQSAGAFVDGNSGLARVYELAFILTIPPPLPPESP